MQRKGDAKYLCFNAVRRAHMTDDNSVGGGFHGELFADRQHVPLTAV